MDLQAFHWERFEPDIGENLKAPPAQRLYLEIACGMTKLQLGAVRRAAKFEGIIVDEKAISEEAIAKGGEPADAIESQFMEKAATQLAEAWAPFVRLGAGAHTIAGRPVTCLRDYLSIVMPQAGGFNVIELSREIVRLNSMTGSAALFSKRLSGGSFSTASQGTDADENATASR